MLYLCGPGLSRHYGTLARAIFWRYYIYNCTVSKLLENSKSLHSCAERRLMEGSCNPGRGYTTPRRTYTTVLAASYFKYMYVCDDGHMYLVWCNNYVNLHCVQILGYGMDDEVGNVSYQLGEGTFEKPYSEHTARLVDERARKLSDDAYMSALEMVRTQKENIIKVLV